MSEIRLPAHDSNHHAWHSRGQFPETCHPCAREVIKRQSEALAIAVSWIEQGPMLDGYGIKYGGVSEEEIVAFLALVRISQQQEGDKR